MVPHRVAVRCLPATAMHLATHLPITILPRTIVLSRLRTNLPTTPMLKMLTVPIPKISRLHRINRMATIRILTTSRLRRINQTVTVRILTTSKLRRINQTVTVRNLTNNQMLLTILLHLVTMLLIHRIQTLPIRIQQQKTTTVRPLLIFQVARLHPAQILTTVRHSL